MTEIAFIVLVCGGALMWTGLTNFLWNRGSTTETDPVGRVFNAWPILLTLGGVIAVIGAVWLVVLALV